MVTKREYKKNHTGFKLRTRAKWPTRGQDVKVLDNILTLGQNSQQYSNSKAKWARQNMIWLNFVAGGLTLGQNSFILNPCFWVCGLR
jgi:hypothetical protein